MTGWVVPSTLVALMIKQLVLLQSLYSQSTFLSNSHLDGAMIKDALPYVGVV
jgi:hypothetical protein